MEGKVSELSTTLSAPIQFDSTQPNDIISNFPTDRNSSAGDFDIY